MIRNARASVALREDIGINKLVRSFKPMEAIEIVDTHLLDAHSRGSGELGRPQLHEAHPRRGHTVRVTDCLPCARGHRA
ncbi:hypothetical protein GCM10027068_20200 [Prescottella soli]